MWLRTVCHTVCVAGAVKYGCNPSLIHARCSRLAYGVRTCRPWEEGAPDRLWHEEDKYFYTKSFFKKYVQRDELVGRDQVGGMAQQQSRTKRYQALPPSLREPSMHPPTRLPAVLSVHKHHAS